MAAGIEERLRQRGAELGFRRIAFAPAGPAPRAEAFRRWLDRGFAGEMAYLEQDPESRADVTIRSPWARTIVSAAFHYGSPLGRPPFDGRLLKVSEEHGGFEMGLAVRSSRGPGEGRGVSAFVSRYAQGVDYHHLVKRRLEDLAHFLKAEGGGRVEARALLDTSAILERDHASTAGVGWTGKNAMVIDPEAGSWFFLGEILTDLVLEPAGQIEDLCGSCTRCIDACPTGAIVEPRIVDSRRCISYLTIEIRGAAPAEHRESIGENLFGCDICQEVCPWNRLAPQPADDSLRTLAALDELSLAESVALDDVGFSDRFKRSAIARAKRGGFVRNALVVAANRGDTKALKAGGALLEDPDPSIRETAVWALNRGEPPERRRAGLAAGREPDGATRERMRRDLES